MSALFKYHVNEKQLLSEEEIILHAQEDLSKFAPLYDKYYEQIFRFVYQRLNDKELAFDITSQVFLKALVNLKKYKSKGLPFSSWLYRIAKSEVYQLFRNTKAEWAINIDEANLNVMAEEIEEQYSEQDHEQLIELLCGLPEEDLQLIEMRYFEKRSFKEISEIIEITENNSKVRVYRILEKLKSQMLKRKIA